DKIVVEAVSFFARQREHLLGSGRKITHGFFTHTTIPQCNILPICPISYLPTAAVSKSAGSPASTAREPYLHAASRVPPPTVFPSAVSANARAACPRITHPPTTGLPPETLLHPLLNA